MKVALVHDYLREYGGAERVVEALREIFPEAPVYTAYHDPIGLGVHAERIKEWDIRTSWMQKVPFGGRLLSPFRIFAPLMFQSFDLSGYDVVISSTAIYFADSVVTKPKTLHLAYIHTPPKYLYGLATSFNYKKHWWTRIGAAVMNHFLRLWDFQIAQRPDVLIANSKNVAERIKKFYRRDSVVIYPPVDVEEIRVQSTKVKAQNKGYYLYLGRLWKGKGVNTVVEVCTTLNLPLKVAGTGPEMENLKKIAGKTVEFLGQVSDEERVKLYAGAKAFIAVAPDEDFGITVVEAMACGTPVIALRGGGYLETVVEGKTGEFVEVDNGGDIVDSIVETLKNFDPQKYKPDDCQKQAEKFSKKRFKKEMLELVRKNLKKGN